MDWSWFNQYVQARSFGVNASCEYLYQKILLLNFKSELINNKIKYLY